MQCHRFFQKKILSIWVFILLGFNSCSSSGWIKPGIKAGDENNRDRQAQVATIDSEDTNTGAGEPTSVVTTDTTGSDTDDTVEVGDTISLKPERKKHDDSFLFKNEPLPEPETSTTDSTKQNKYPVKYSGHQFVREVKYHPRAGRKTVILAIRGNARIIRGPNTIRSQSIEVIGEDADLALARRYVNIHDSEQNTTLTGGYGEYIKSEQRALVKNKPTVTHIHPKTKVKTMLTADEIERRFATAQTSCYGNVVLRGKEFVVFAEKAVYYEKEDRVEMTGVPRIFHQKSVYIADKITFFNSKKKGYLEGNVQIWMTTEENDRQKKPQNTATDKKGVVTSIIYAQRAVYEYGPLVYLGRKTTLVGSENRPVVIQRPDSHTRAGQVEAWGEGPTRIKVTRDIRMKYKVDNTLILAESALHDKFFSSTELKAAKDADGINRRPVVVFFDDGGDPSGYVEARIIEKGALSSKLQARGQVEIEMLEKEMSSDNIDRAVLKKNGSVRISGEWAEYDPDKKEAHVYGNPNIKQGGQVMYSREIIVYPQEKRFEMLGSIHGSMGTY